MVSIFFLFLSALLIQQASKVNIQTPIHTKRFKSQFDKIDYYTKNKIATYSANKFLEKHMKMLGGMHQFKKKREF